MKAEIDKAACIGCGICKVTCPGVFSTGDDGFASVIVDEIPAASEDGATQAMDGCPTGAIFLFEASDHLINARKHKDRMIPAALRSDKKTPLVKASANLIEEHDRILIGLKILEEMVFLKRNSEEVAISDFSDILDFMTIFADKCHQGKEEDIYFPSIEAAGIKRQDGPIGKMFMDHIEGREHIFKMTELAKEFQSDENQYMEAATDFIRLLRVHIETESTNLFPMGDAVVPADVQKKMIAEFEKYEETVIGKGTLEKHYELLHRLEKKYLGKT